MQQKQIELRHLTELALGIVKEEHAAVQKGGITDADAQKRALARVATLRYGNNDYFWVNDMHPRMVMHPMKPEMNGNDISTFKDPNGKALFVDFVNVVKKDGAGFVPYEWPKPGFDKPQPKLSYVAGFAPWNWVIGTGVYIDDLNAQTWASTQRSLLAAGLMLLLTIAVSIVVAGSITKPLRRMTVAMNDLASGKLDVEVPGIGRSDEVGEMAKAVEIFKSNAVARQALEAEQKEAETRAVARRKADMIKMADDFEGAVGEIVETVSSAVDRTGGVGRYADIDRRARAGTHHHGRGRVRGSLHQRAVGGVGDRGNGVVGQRDQPSGPGIRRGWPAMPSARPAPPTIASANCRRRRPASATSSN